MKKLAVLMLLPVVFFLLSGCFSAGTVSNAIEQVLPPQAADKVYERFPSLRSQEITENGVFVYRIASGGSAGGELIRPEVLERPEGAAGDLEARMELFLSPAQENGLSRAVPDGVEIESSSLKDGVLTLVFSPEYMALSAMERTTAAFCATLTFCAVDGIEAVSIKSGGRIVFAGLMPEDALLTDTVADPYVRQLRLYFSDADGRYLISEYHSLTLDEETSPERYVVEELLRGPYNPELRSVIPEGTRLLSCVTDGGICKVDLSAEFYQARPQTAAGERLTIYSIVNSLTALSGVDSVLIQVEGQSVPTYRYRSLSQPLARYEEVIGPVSEPKGEFDTDLYLPLPGLSAITPIPFRVQETDYASRAEAVLGALLNCEEPGYPSILHGTASIVGVLVQDDVCTIDLSESFFVSLPENARNVAVQSMAASICELPDVTDVCFTVGGENAVFDGRDWSGPWTNFNVFEVK